MIRPTRLTSLVGYALAAAVVGFALPTVWLRLTDRQFPVPWSSTTALVIVALAIGFWAFEVKRRLSGGIGVRKMNSHVAVRTSALALAASRAGALVGGVYLGVGLYYAQATYLRGSIPTALAQDRIVSSLSAVVASGLLIVAALWLEKICRVEPGDDESIAENPAAS